MEYMRAANRKHELNRTHDLSAASSSSDAVANTPKAEFSEVGPVFDALTILQRRCMSKDEKRTLLALMEVAETSASDGPSGQKQILLPGKNNKDVLFTRLPQSTEEGCSETIRAKVG